MRLCSDCDELYICFSFYIFFLSILACSSLLFIALTKQQIVTPRGALCLIVGSCPPMSSLSDRNMRLGDVILPPGIKQRCLYLRVQGLFTLRRVILMQSSVALSLHFGWDSQLNTSEMFQIDISRRMISEQTHMDFGLLTLAYYPLLLSPSFLCSIVNIAVPS